MCCWETRCKQACNPETLSGHLSCSFVHQDQQCGFPLKKKDWVQRKHRVCNESGVCAPSRVQTDCCNLRLGQPTQKPSSHPPRFLLPARGIFMNWRTLFGLHCKLQFKIRSLQFCALTSGGPPPTTHPPTHPERFLVQFSRADAVLLTGSSSIEETIFIELCNYQKSLDASVSFSLCWGVHCASSHWLCCLGAGSLRSSTTNHQLSCLLVQFSTKRILMYWRRKTVFIGRAL